MKSEKLYIPKGNTFFTRDRQFYRAFFKLALLIIFQNIFTYTVNIADNIMLGSYSQASLSGAAAINQIQFVVQAVIASALGQGISIVGSQYWGKNETDPIQTLTGIALKIGLAAGAVLTIAALISPRSLATIFTYDEVILEQAVQYLQIIRFTYLFFICTNILYATLRSMQIADIAFKLSIMTLLINVGINNCLIFGKFGLPELGIQGAAMGTLIARIAEFFVLLIYIAKSKRMPFQFSMHKLLQKDEMLRRNYLKVTCPCIISMALFSGATAMQTAIFGHLDSDAIAANAMTNTMYQYCKIIPIGASSAAGALIGKSVGNREWNKLREYVNSLQFIFIGIGLIAAVLFVLISHVLLGFYSLTPTAISYAKQMFVVLGFIVIASGYQSPCLMGIIGGGGDSRFVMLNDILYAGCFTVPVCLISAFIFHLGVIPLVILMNIDQVFKCITNGIKVNRYTWIKIWTTENH